MALSSVGGSVASLAASRSSRSNHSGETSSPFSSFLRAAAGSQEEAARTAAAAEASGATGQSPDLKQQADKALADFRQSVTKLLSDAGIDTSHKIRLESDGQGGVHVAGDHPDREKIEQLLARQSRTGRAVSAACRAVSKAAFSGAVGRGHTASTQPEIRPVAA